jgi:predicted type IV restriction endonuclease
MLTSAKQSKLLDSLKKYSKKYLNGKYTELDESGTRLMINEFLSQVLGYEPIEEIKTEYMIKGTYADYVIQLKGNRHFLVEVKALSLNLNSSHLRQATNYGANEGIDWALLTNGKCFEFYKILFNKPIESRKVFSLDFSDTSKLKASIELLQFLHKDSVGNKGLEMLWNKSIALDPANVAGYLYTPAVINHIKKSLKEKYKHKFTDEEIKISIDAIVFEEIKLEHIKHVKIKKEKSKLISTANDKETIELEKRFEVHETAVDSLGDSLSENK